MSKLDESIIYATKQFSGKYRKCSGEPAILHSLEVASIISSMTKDEDIMIAGVLHDTIEDTGASEEEIRLMFGDRVCQLVLSETENKRKDTPPEKTWKTRKIETLDFLRNNTDIGVEILYLGDKLSNIRTMENDYRRFGDKLWSFFNQKDPEEHHWYYREIATIIQRDLGSYPAFKEYDQRIKELFNEKGDGKDE